MIIRINTEDKTISLEGDVNLQEFINELSKLVPVENFKEYKLCMTVEYLDYPYQTYPTCKYDPYLTIPWTF